MYSSDVQTYRHNHALVLIAPCVAHMDAIASVFVLRPVLPCQPRMDAQAYCLAHMGATASCDRHMGAKASRDHRCQYRICDICWASGLIS